MEQTIALCFPVFEKMTYYQFSPIIAEFRIGPTGTGTGIAEGFLPYSSILSLMHVNFVNIFDIIDPVLVLYAALDFLSDATSFDISSPATLRSLLF
jgi:hypothetical protein